MPKSETEIKRVKFWKKKWVPTTSCVTEKVSDTSSRNSSASVYQHKYFQHFPFLPCLISGCRRARCWTFSPQKPLKLLILHNTHCLALRKHFLGITEEQETRSKGWGQLRKTVADLVESRKTFPLWVFKSNRMQLRQLEGTALQSITQTCLISEVLVTRVTKKGQVSQVVGKLGEEKFSWAADGKVRIWQGTKLQSVVNNCYTAFSQLPLADILSLSWKKCIGWKRVGWLTTAEERGITAEIPTEEYSLI